MARIETAIALVGSAMHSSRFELREHLTKEAKGSVKSQDTLVRTALSRAGVTTGGRSVFGRRSNNIQDWGQDFLRLLERNLDDNDGPTSQTLLDIERELISTWQRLQQSMPIGVSLAGKAAKAVVLEVLTEAERRGLVAAVAQFLVGAKLFLRFPELRDHIRIAGSNAPDRTIGSFRRGDFDLGTFVFEVCVGPPDLKHFVQAETVLRRNDSRFWLLVREDRWISWNEEHRRRGMRNPRFVICSVEQFVGQNVTEMSGLAPDKEAAKLRELFDVYNNQWISVVGSPGMRVQCE